MDGLRIYHKLKTKLTYRIGVNSSDCVTKTDYIITFNKENRGFV